MQSSGIALEGYRGFNEYFSEEEKIPLPLRHQLRRRQALRLQYAFTAGLMIMLVAFGVYFLSQNETVQKLYLYPYSYKESVAACSREYGVDSSLVAGVIRAESKFNADVRSNRGAIGLMQLMPETGRWISEQIDSGSFVSSSLYEPDVNVRYGTWYLANLLDEFNGNEVLALAAYNAGRGNVADWMMEKGWGYDFSDVEAIPFPETREYVKQVLKNKSKYEALYKS